MNALATQLIAPLSPCIEGSLTGLPRTLLIPLAARVAESLDPDQTFSDGIAEQLARRLARPLSATGCSWNMRVCVAARTQLLDQHTRSFLATHPNAQVVNLGAGLCTRLWRVDDGAVRWIDVDLPDAIALRARLLPGHPRLTLHATSALDEHWHTLVDPQRPLLIIAEGLLVYFKPQQVWALLRRVGQRHPGAQLLMEAIAPFVLNNPFAQLRPEMLRCGARFRWGLRSPAQLLRQVPGARVLGVHHHFEQQPERWRWMRPLLRLGWLRRSMRIVHLQYTESPAQAL